MIENETRRKEQNKNSETSIDENWTQEKKRGRN
jgi:hypothetical protein